MKNEKIICEIRKSRNQSAIFWDGIFSGFVGKAIYLMLWLASILAVFEIFSFYFSGDTSVSESMLGLCFIVLALFLLAVTIRVFVGQELIQPVKDNLNQLKTKIAANESVNIFDSLSFDLSKALKPVLSQKKIVDISLNDIVKAIFSADDMTFVTLRLGLSSEEILKSLEDKKDLLIDLLVQAVDVAIVNNHDSVWSPDLLVAVGAYSPKLVGLWRDLNISDTDVSSLISWQTKIIEKMKAAQGLFNPNNLKKTGGIGREWVFGYTNFLRQYSLNLTETIESNGLNLEVIGRDKEIRQINEALSKQASANVLLVGGAGVGKRATVLGFAKKMIEGDSAQGLQHDIVFQVDTEAVISGAVSEGEIVERLSQILEEASDAGNVIILIENIDHLFSAEGVGTADLSAVMMPHLENSSMHVIGTCEVAPYNKYILSNSTLSSHFVRVSVDAPSADDLVKILEDTAPMIESKTGSIITYEAIKVVMKKSAKYLVNATEPERSIGMLEGVATRATSERGKTLILDKDVDDYLVEKMKLPSGQATEEEKGKLLNLEKTMHENVIGQDEAIKAVADALRRNRAQISDSAKPIGSFLFLGPTGVGKTATAKSLAKAYFGGSGEMIRFDMSEYQNKSDIYRLIGTKTEPGNLTTAVTENPFALLLFDEIEKADPDILNLFLQILDEGILTDGRDQKIVFANTIIIATSNAGSNMISQAIENGEDYAKVQSTLSSFLASENIFKPEFLNRFTEVIAFSPLSMEAIKQVAGLLVAELSKSILEKQGIAVTIAPDALEALATMGYDPKMGARPMERVMADKIENLLANKLLKNELKKDDKITITKEMIS